MAKKSVSVKHSRLVGKGIKHESKEESVDSVARAVAENKPHKTGQPSAGEREFMSSQEVQELAKSLRPSWVALKMHTGSTKAVVGETVGVIVASCFTILNKTPGLDVVIRVRQADGDAITHKLRCLLIPGQMRFVKPVLLRLGYQSIDELATRSLLGRQVRVLIKEPKPVAPSVKVIEVIEDVTEEEVKPIQTAA